MEPRIAKLESGVTDLRVNAASVLTSVENLKEAVIELRQVVQELRDTMNKGRGVIWVFGSLSMVIGGAVEALARKLLT